MKRKIRGEQPYFSAPHNWHLLLLCSFFLIGAVTGHILAHTFGFDSRLQKLILQFSSSAADAPRPSPWTVLAVYFRFPLLALLFGYFRFVPAAMPALLLAQGFSLSFSASALAVSFGKAGVPLALASFGLQSLITILCTLILALWSFKHSAGHDRENLFPIPFMGICFFLLILGVILELTILPPLFSSALAGLES